MLILKHVIMPFLQHVALSGWQLLVVRRHIHSTQQTMADQFRHRSVCYAVVQLQNESKNLVLPLIYYR